MTLGKGAMGEDVCRMKLERLIRHADCSFAITAQLCTEGEVVDGRNRALTNSCCLTELTLRRLYPTGIEEALPLPVQLEHSLPELRVTTKKLREWVYLRCVFLHLFMKDSFSFQLLTQNKESMKGATKVRPLSPTKKSLYKCSCTSARSSRTFSCE